MARLIRPTFTIPGLFYHRREDWAEGVTVENSLLGTIDELGVYNARLTADEIHDIYHAGSKGKHQPSSTTPALDSDQDGIPDYWEITLGTDPNTPSNNNDRDSDGYTDLEEYINWLAAPHALTVINTPVSVDLYALAGDTGDLTFSVANAVNGTVDLTNNVAPDEP